MRVAEVMSRVVRTVGNWEEIEVPADLARFGRYRALPVLDKQGQLVGMLARSDVIELAIPRGAPRRFKVADLARARPAFVREDAELDDAARLMLAKHANTLPVLDAAGKVVGMLTDADLDAVLAGRRAPVRAFEEVPVWNVMTANPTTVEEGATLETAARMMLEGGYRHLPVVDNDGNLTGMISERMIREKIGTDLTSLYHAPPEATQDLVGNTMRPDPLTVRADARLIDAFDLFADERFAALPVLDEDDNLVGILSYVDVLNWLREHARPMGEPVTASPAP
ncbi:MAG: CBS domain-containing protein [Myxococcales bacterium]|jgi:CBS-domain-containing membrane protein